MPNPDEGAFIGRTPLLAVGRVDGYDSESHSVLVRLQSWQVPFPARMLINGNCDGVRIDQQPLPVTGTWGLVAFPIGDYRNAIWLGSFVNGTATSIGAQSTDAINSSSSDPDSQMRYFSHFSGYYDLLDSIGNYFSRWPDGTRILVNSDDNEPTTYRHVVDSNGMRQRIPFDDSYRTPNPPSPFYVSVQHPTGSSFTITPSGKVVITSPNPVIPPFFPHLVFGAGSGFQQSSETLTASGIVSFYTGGDQEAGTNGPILEMNPLSAGGVAPQGTASGSFQIIGQDSFSDINMDKDGNITIESTGANRQILIASNGDVEITSFHSTITAAASGNITIQSDTSTIDITADGDISITSNSGNVNVTSQAGEVNVSGAGNVTVESVAGDILLPTDIAAGRTDGVMSINEVIYKFNHHHHGGVQSGSSNTDVPVLTDQLP